MRGYAGIVGVFRQKRGFLPDRVTLGFNRHFKPNPLAPGAGNRDSLAAGAACRATGVGEGWAELRPGSFAGVVSTVDSDLGILRDPARAPNESIVH